MPSGGQFARQPGAALAALAGAAGQRGQPLGGRGEVARGDARLPVEGAQPPAAGAAVVVGAAVADRPQHADDGARAVAVVGGGAVAVRAAYAGPLVAVFFWARRCW